MKARILKEKLIAIAQDYLKLHPIDANDGHVNQDIAEFLLQITSKVDDKILLIASAEQLMTGISEWNSIIKASANLIGKGLFSKALIGSTLKNDLYTLIEIAKKQLSEAEMSRYKVLGASCGQDIAQQMKTKNIIINFEIQRDQQQITLSDNVNNHTVKYFANAAQFSVS